MINDFCDWSNAAPLLLSSGAGSTIYYVHILIIASSLFLGYLVLLNNPRGRSNRVLFLLSIILAAWTSAKLVLWLSPAPEVVMFFQSVLTPIELLVYLLTGYLVYLFTQQQNDASTGKKLLFSTLLLPTVLFAHTSLNIVGIAADCHGGTHSGVLVQYLHLAELVIIFAIVYYFVKNLWTSAKTVNKKLSTYVSLAALLFLVSLSLGNLAVSFGGGVYYAQLAFFSLPIFMLIAAYAVIRLQPFTIRSLLLSALTAGLWVMMLSLLLLDNLAWLSLMLVVVALAFAAVGVVLFRSVSKTTEQAIKIDRLDKQLATATARLEALDKQKTDFVTIASQQLRGPLTALRGYTSLLREGSLGVMPSQATEPLANIDESAKTMSYAIEDYLNICKLESGNLKYSPKDFNLPNEVEHITDKLRSEALQKGLVLYFKKSLHNQGVVHADLVKTSQIIHNLLNNAIRYTAAGTITVLVHSNLKNKKIFVDITDTGAGLDQTRLDTIFQKFQRTDDTDCLRVSGTGLSLFVAKTMATAMGGNITAYSQGAGKGTRFTFELPLAM